MKREKMEMELLDKKNIHPDIIREMRRNNQIWIERETDILVGGKRLSERQKSKKEYVEMHEANAILRRYLLDNGMTSVTEMDAADENELARRMIQAGILNPITGLFEFRDSMLRATAGYSAMSDYTFGLAGP